MTLRPVITGRIAAAMPQQEGEQLLPSAHQVRIHGEIKQSPTKQVPTSATPLIDLPGSRA
jgi:hypothetical protein